jgi:hypothetical protein
MRDDVTSRLLHASTRSLSPTQTVTGMLHASESPHGQDGMRMSASHGPACVPWRACWGLGASSENCAREYIRSDDSSSCKKTGVGNTRRELQSAGHGVATDRIESLSFACFFTPCTLLLVKGTLDTPSELVTGTKERPGHYLFGFVRVET